MCGGGTPSETVGLVAVGLVAVCLIRGLIAFGSPLQRAAVGRGPAAWLPAA
jgi:hypothetical protein